MDTNQKEFYQNILIIACIVGIVVVYFLFTIIRQQRRNMRLQNERIYTEITTLEKERRRIANDLHDEVGPMLAAVKLNLGGLSTDSLQDNILMQKTTGHIDSLIKRLREIASDLLPTILVRKGLVKAIELYIEDINDSGKLKVIFSSDKELLVPKEFEAVLYRICLEIIHNTIKHSGVGKQLQIEMRNENKRLLILAQDNGKGFDLHKTIGNQSGLGLESISSRAEMMGGECTFDSEPGKGVKIVIEIPV